MFSRLLLIPVLPVFLFAQAESARLMGVVTDPAGAVVANAKVTFLHVATGGSSSVQSNGEGRYSSLPLRIGEYRVEVQAEGFKRTVRSGVVLEIQQTAQLDLRLELGVTAESIDVTADAPLLATTEASQGQVINNKRIVDMPLNGRNYVQLALLSVGAVETANGARFSTFSAAGQRAAQNNFMLDGIDNNNVQLAAQGRQAETVQPSVDAIQEFKISTNSFSAEYGRATGAVVNATIKSGSNDLHGTVFEFLRNEALDAKNFFDSPSSKRPPFKRNQYGFSLGGPIVRNKTFFFGDYEWTDIRESRTANNTIPTLAMRAGDFSAFRNIVYDPATYNAQTRARQPFANNRIPEARFDRVARQAIAWYPAPQNGDLTQNYLANPPNISDIGRGDVRVDHSIRANDTIYFRYSRQSLFEPSSPSLPPPAFGSDSTDFRNTGTNMGLVWSHTWSPRLLTTSRVGWNRLFTNEQPATTTNANATIGLRGVDNTTSGAPRFNISDVTGLGIGANLPNLNDSQTRQFVTDSTFVTGAHSFKFGANISFLQAFITNPKEGLGVFAFNGNFTRNPANSTGGNPTADFLLGMSNQTDIANPVYSNLRSPFYQFYVQDEWRASRKLSLSLGLRYERNGNWVETRNMLSNYDIDDPAALKPVIVAKDGSRFSRALIRDDTNNFAPRFGFAYSADSKTVVRGAFGMFVGNYEGTGGGRFMLGNPPNTISVRLTTDSITPAFTLQNGVPEGSLDPRNVTNLRLSSFQTNPKWPTALQWNLNIQRQFASDFVWEIGYYAAKSTHLPTRWNANYALPGAGNINNRRQFTRLTYPGTNFPVTPLTIVDRHDWFGNSQFHSLQTRLEKRLSSGSSFLIGYTFSKTIGDTGGFSAAGNPPGTPQGFQNPLNRRLEKALDDQNLRHRLVASHQYDLPFGKGRRFGSNWKGVSDAVFGGWSIGGITTLASGQPMGLTVRGDQANTGDPNRPNVVGDWHLSRDARTLDRFFNTAAFVPNAQFTYGNAARNLLEQPGLVNVDFASFKRFQVTERIHTQFRFEAFNLFNTPNFGAPTSEVGNVNFGRITGAGRSRNLQFGLKVIF
ncbi:MAG: carboxypeptidase regulatory-like domain-containing protein [Acidobacteria bacterium]|nr:carboxypeptidase regulatory-like domain-containing protein [Acidobacteriota bacterium]